MSSTATIKLPPKLVPLFTPARGDLRFRVAHGSRGSGKSFSFAMMAAVWGYAEPLRILCTREMQNSIKESMHAEIKSAIESVPWLANHYDVGVDYIKGANGTSFLFRGLRHNISSIKSMAQIDLCIVEEASDVPNHSWQALLPTIRAPKSEIWCVYNPKSPTDPVDVMFRQSAPPRSMVVEIGWQDNPWFPPELEEQRKHAQEVMNPADYAWIWEGAYLTNSDAQVLSGKVRVAEFSTPTDAEGPYHGADWGFAQDPTTGVKCWVKGDTLMVEYEAYKVGLDIDDTAAYLIEHIPGITDYITRGDSARPETISYLKRNGLPRIEGVKKWPGSVEDGVQFMRSFREIVIHPRCKETIKEARLYSYKVDRLTGDILPVILDANNHMMDAIRYALQPMIKNKYGKLAPIPISFSN
jgi:phage terminase large subunit